MPAGAAGGGRETVAGDFGVAWARTQEGTTMSRLASLALAIAAVFGTNMALAQTE
jgi:hypothetical protein